MVRLLILFITFFLDVGAVSASPLESGVQARWAALAQTTPHAWVWTELQISGLEKAQAPTVELTVNGRLQGEAGACGRPVTALPVRPLLLRLDEGRNDVRATVRDAAGRPLAHASGVVVRTGSATFEAAPRLVVQRGLRDPGRWLHLSPDGRTLLAEKKSSILVVRAEDGRQLGQLGPMPDDWAGRARAAWWDDGRHVLAPAREAGSLSIWDVDRREPVATRWTGLSLEDLALGMEGNCIAVIHNFGRVQLLDIHLQPLGQLSVSVTADRNTPLGARRLKFSPDGKRLLVDQGNGWLVLWDVAQQRQIHAWRTETDKILALAFDFQGRPLSVSSDGRATLWDEAGRPLRRTPADWPAMFGALATSDGWWFETANGALRVDRAFGELVQPAEIDSALLLSRDGQSLFGVREGGGLGRWRQPDGQLQWLRYQVDHGFGSLKLSRDGRLALTGAASTVDNRHGGVFRVWDLEAGKPIASIDEGEMPKRFRIGPELSPDGEWIASASDIGDVRVWRSRSTAPMAVPPLFGQTVTAIAFSGDGLLLAVATVDDHRGAALLDGLDRAMREITASVQAVDQIEEIVGPLYQQTIQDRTARVQIWSLNEQRWVGVQQIDAVVTTIVAGSSADEWILGGLRGEVHALSGAHVQRLRAADHFGWNALAISPDGRRLLRASTAEAAYIWERRGHELIEIERLPGSDADNLLAAAWGADDDHVLLNEPKTGLRLRRIQPQVNLGTIELEDGPAQLFSVSDDGQVLMYDDGLLLLDVKRRERTQLLPPWSFNYAEFLQDQRLVLTCRNLQARVRKWSVLTLDGRQVAAFEQKGQTMPRWVQGTLHYDDTIDDRQVLVSFDLATGSTTRIASAKQNDFVVAAVAHLGSRRAFFGLGNGELVEVDVPSGRELKRTRLSIEPVMQLAVADKGDRLLIHVGGVLMYWSLAQNRALRTFETGGTAALAFEANDTLAHLTSRRYMHSHEWIDLATGATVRSLEGQVSPNARLYVEFEDQKRYVLRSLAPVESAPSVSWPDTITELHLLPNGRTALGLDAFGLIGAWRLSDGARMLTLAPLSKDAWFAADTEGRFDASRLDAIEDAHWTLGTIGRETAPVDLYLKEYYAPGLLGRVLAGETLPPVGSLARRDRRTARLTAIEARVDATTGLLDVEIAWAAPPGSAAVDLRDLKLFFNGQLVARAFDRQPLRLGTEAVRHRFRGLQPPGILTDGRIAVTAYGFNASGVRTETARTVLSNVDVREGAQPRAHLLAVGIDHYQHAALRLRYAGADADAMLASLAPRLQAQGWPVLSHGVRSDLDRAERGTKRHVLAALQGLAHGADAVKPTDMVVISYAGHGARNAQGEFYLLTREYSPTGELIDGVEGAISMSELADALLLVNAAHWVLVIDACHSAATVTGGNFKPGPTGSRGLGQLAFDKRMRVLAASHEAGAAGESDRLAGGFLTYALMHDGLVQGLADHRPRDGRTTVSEWLQFALTRVPELAGSSLLARRSARGATLVGALAQPRFALQTPALFDFALEGTRADPVVNAGSPIQRSGTD